MTRQYYQGWQIGGSGDWFDPTSWSGDTIPVAGETVIIATPGPIIGPTASGAIRGGLNNITVDVQPAFRFSQPVLTGNDITYGVGFTLNFLDNPDSQTTAPAATMVANGRTLFRGTMNLDAPDGSFTIDVSGQLGSGTFVDAGSARINVENRTTLAFVDSTLGGLTNNGTIAISGHSTAEVGPVDGHGRFTLKGGSTLQLNGAVAVTEKIKFLSGNDTLILNGASVGPTGSSLDASGDISGFRGGDVIQLSSPSDQPTSVVYLQPYHILAVYDASGGVVAKLRLDGNYQSNAFALTSDGKGNFDITLAGSTASSAGGADHPSVLQAAGLDPATDFPVAGGTSSVVMSGSSLASSPEAHADTALPFGSAVYSDHNASIPLSVTNHGAGMG
ncbi:MAG TPA: hypothetical protein VHU42_05715 [Rhodopila sp.]|nr:hypothetical protein [Rhodopila sp.]